MMIKAKLKGFGKTVTRNKKFLVGIIVFLTIPCMALSVYPLGIPHPGWFGDAQAKSPPSLNHPLGTDSRARDLLVVLLYSTQMSLLIGSVAGVMGCSIGIIMGFVSGYKGGLIDDIMRTFFDVFMTIPLLPILALAMVAFKGLGVFGMAILLGLFSWPGAARTIRSQVLSLKEREFVNLAKISGLGDLEVIVKELMPNLLPYIAIRFVGSFVGAMYAEIGLEIIGLGPQYVNTLGFIFGEVVKNVAVLKGWWWMVLPPTAFVITIFLSLYIITVGIDEIANPRLKKITGR